MPSGAGSTFGGDGQILVCSASELTNNGVVGDVCPPVEAGPALQAHAAHRAGDADQHMGRSAHRRVIRPARGVQDLPADIFQVDLDLGEQIRHRLLAD